MNSLKTKILSLITLVIVAIVAISGYIGFEIQKRMTSEMAEQNNAILTETIKSSISNAMRSGLSAEVGAILSQIRNQDVIKAIRIVDQNGTILNSADPGEVGKAIPQTEAELLKQGATIPLHRSTTNDSNLSMAPLYNSPACHSCHPPSKAILGFLYTELSLKQLDALTARQRNSVIISAIAIILLVTVTISTFFFFYVDKPIQKIVAAMQKVENGDFQAKTVITSSTEMQRFSENFNLMVDKLNTMMDTTVNNERELTRAQEKLTHHHEMLLMNHRLEEQLAEIENLNISLEERIEEIEEANYKIADLAGELEDKNTNLEKAVAKLSTLYKVGLAINSTMELKNLFNLIVRTTMRTMDAQIGYLFLYDAQEKKLRVTTLLGYEASFTPEITIEMKPSSISTWVIESRQPLLISDINKTPHFDRFSSLGYERKTLVSAPLLSKNEVIGTITVVNKLDDSQFTEEDLELLTTIAAQASIAIRNAQLYENQQKSYINTIHALVSAIEASDSYTKGHSERVTKYSVALATKLNLAPERIKVIERAAILHDIGKIGIDLTLLHKEGKLTPEDICDLQQHPLIGMRILEPIEFLQDVRLCIGQHHERYDGRGYPNNIPASELLLESRMLAIADAYDAMTSDRPYRKALKKQAAIKELRENAGSQFDPELVPHFIELLENSSLDNHLAGSLHEQPRLKRQETLYAV